jgi:hypothetical protein
LYSRELGDVFVSLESTINPLQHGPDVSAPLQLLKRQA